jgi:hypothetical protein
MVSAGRKGAVGSSHPWLPTTGTARIQRETLQDGIFRQRTGARTKIEQRESRAPTRRIKKPGEDTARELYRADEWGLKKALPIRNPRKSKGTESCQEQRSKYWDGWDYICMCA